MSEPVDTRRYAHRAVPYVCTPVLHHADSNFPEAATKRDRGQSMHDTPPTAPYIHATPPQRANHRHSAIANPGTNNARLKSPAQYPAIPCAVHGVDRPYGP